MGQDLSARRVRAGIVGGGSGAFIGAVHRAAAELDGQALVVASALSSDPASARASAAAWCLDRCYEAYAAMARAEAARPDGIDVVIIATPNDLHCEIARVFLENGIAVICDKPMTRTLAEAEELVELVGRSGQVFALTHNYSAYPAVREARERVRRGELGELRKVLVEYHQDWLMNAIEATPHRQARWRTDPQRAGISCCVADIGTHAQHLLEFVSGTTIASLCADLTSFVPGRTLDDDANILVRLAGGAKGTLTCSQVACGEENRLGIRLYGSRAALEWHQQEPNTLLLKPAGEPWQQLRTGSAGQSAASRAVSRLPAGHPEGYLEAFASLYRLVFDDLRRRARGEPPLGGYPTVHDGLRGMKFIERAVQSSGQGGVWLDLG